MQFINILSLLIAISISQKPIKTKNLIGSWTFTKNIDNVLNYSKTDTVSKATSYVFEKNNIIKVKERIVDGFCGTPPHRYRIITGSWILENNNLIISYESIRNSRIVDRNGNPPSHKKVLKYNIVELTKDVMKLKRN